MKIIFLLSFFASITAFADCASPTAVAGENRWFSSDSDMKYCDGTNWISMTVAATATACTTTGKVSISGSDIVFCNGSVEVSMNGVAMTTCTAGESGTITYDSSLSGMKWCNGTNWRRMTKSQGYFVRISAARNAGLGGLSGANAKCLTDLTNNDFMGKSNAIIDANHVKAFICTATTCQDLKPWTSYAFAVSGSPADGGATFSTNGSGQGPGNSINWSLAANFNTTTKIWMGRAAGTATNWSLSAVGGCSDWSVSGSGPTGRSGTPNNTDSKRWYDSSVTCDTALYFICAVNPY